MLRIVGWSCNTFEVGIRRAFLFERCELSGNTGTSGANSLDWRGEPTTFFDGGDANGHSRRARVDFFHDHEFCWLERLGLKLEK